MSSPSPSHHRHHRGHIGSRVISRSAEVWFEGHVAQLMEFNIGDHTALKLAEADTRREALDEATRDAPPGAGDGLGSQTEPDDEPYRSSRQL